MDGLEARKTAGHESAGLMWFIRKRENVSPRVGLSCACEFRGQSEFLSALRAREVLYV
jgi:hypothetical protein